MWVKTASESGGLGRRFALPFYPVHSLFHTSDFLVSINEICGSRIYEASILSGDKMDAIPAPITYDMVRKRAHKPAYSCWLA
jgi:hypothetical protein